MVKDAPNRLQQGLEIHKRVPPSGIEERAAVRNCSFPSTKRRRRKKKKNRKKKKKKRRKNYVVCSICSVVYCWTPCFNEYAEFNTIPDRLSNTDF